MRDQLGMFDEADRLGRLSAMGDPLERVAAAIDWEQFRPTLDAALSLSGAGPGGRPPFDYVLMFKIAMLQQWYNIADDATEYLINDRLSFQRFLGLGLGDKVPDAKTIWSFRDRLAKAGAAKALFDLFAASLEAQGTITRTGSIVDASFVDVPRQRNSREDNATIKEGGVPNAWQEPEAAPKLAQKDVDARWTTKNKERHYGYKDHIKADADSKLIVDYAVTDASVHDSKALAGLVDASDKVLWADSAYVGEALHEEVRKKSLGIVLNVHEKGYRGRPLTDAQKQSNKEKSHVRVRVEHIFGDMTAAMGGMVARCIGLARNECAIGLKNLAYNMRRSTFLDRKAASVVR